MSPNDRVQQLFHPWTSYLVVPLFALANAGITVDGSLLARTYTSPVTALLPEPLRARALLGAADTITDLAVPVDPECDHVRGADQALVTLVEYGDYECPYCGEAEPVIRELLAGYGDLRYVWRHLPLTDVHSHALLAAEGAEAAARQGKFWQMHDQLLAHQDALTAEDLIRYAGGLGLDTGRFTADLCRHAGDAKIAEDLDSAGLSGVSGTPSFFVNGKRHRGAYDIDTLAGQRVAVRARPGKAVRRRHRHARRHGHRRRGADDPPGRYGLRSRGPQGVFPAPGFTRRS
jgi:protein-disulfide isomerase